MLSANLFYYCNFNLVNLKQLQQYKVVFFCLLSCIRLYELHDLINDPLQITNLAYDPAYSEVRKDLEEQLHQLEIEKLWINMPKDV
nr:sulfatase/phosphatase domain-containing protein [Flavobacterium sp. LM4]